MNSRQKETTKYNLDAEQEVLRKLKGIYKKALDDINEKIAALEGRTDVENLQSIIYQKDYQNALKKQISAILDELNTDQFTTISDYLAKCYENGFLSTMYDLQGQGIPIITPIDQKQVVRAVQHDTKLSKSLYDTLGEDVSLLKKRIANNISRGIAQGSSYADIARNIASGMVGDYSRMKGGKLSKAMTIARTEGHRIQCEAAFDAQKKAKEKGADVVKQWDATLDKRTRESHAKVDGELRELDDKFSNGLLFPGDPSGGAAEVVNCRCALLQRAKWALDEDELQTLKERAEYFGLDKSENFEDFKKKYKIATSNGLNQDEIKKRRKQYFEKIKSKQIPKNIDDCKTINDVENLTKSKRWFYSKEINGKIFDSNDAISFSGCDVECAKGIFRACEKVFEEYPEMIGKLNGVTSGRHDRFIYAVCSFGLGHGGISVNDLFFRDVEKVRSRYEIDCLSGFHPKGTTWESIIIHEFGHAIDDYFTNTMEIAGLNPSGRQKNLSSKMRAKVMKSVGLKLSDIGTEVSGYATKDANEWFAECFAESVSSSNPRKTAKEFKKQLAEYMKEVN